MTIKCEERYAEAKVHAEKLGDKSLQECIDKLERWESDRAGSTMYLTKDFAPYSFLFKLVGADGEVIINGGLIYHGTPDLSRSVTFDTKNLWQTHT